MTPSDVDDLIEDEKTRPPVVTTRYDTVSDLYAGIPQIAELTQQRPRGGEEPLEYLWRLRSSTTPEEAVTFTAFAIQPKLAIWWGHECLRAMPDALSPLDRQMMEQVANWIGRPEQDMRHEVMRHALYAPSRGPGVHLALSVGWSGGSIAPNDTANVPPHRAPRAINTSILSCLARADLNRRPILLAKFIDMAESLFKVY